VWETWILNRTLLELVANQLYVEANQDRVFEFMRRGSKRQQRLAKVGEETGYVKEEDWKALAASAQREISKLRPFDTKGLAFSDKAQHVMSPFLNTPVRTPSTPVHRSRLSTSLVKPVRRTLLTCCSTANLSLLSISPQLPARLRMSLRHSFAILSKSSLGQS
jgi:hypothetical protein